MPRCVVASNWDACWRDLPAHSPSDIWFDTPRFPTSPVARVVHNLGRVVSLGLYFLLFFLNTTYPHTPGRIGADGVPSWFFQLTNWNIYIGLALYCWLVIRKFNVGQASLDLAVREQQSQSYGATTTTFRVFGEKAGERVCDDDVDRSPFAVPQRVLMRYQGLRRTALLVFLKEISVIMIILVAGFYFLFLYNPANYIPVSTEFYRETQIHGVNKHKFKPLAKGRTSEFSAVATQVTVGGNTASGNQWLPQETSSARDEENEIILEYFAKPEDGRPPHRHPLRKPDLSATISLLPSNLGDARFKKPQKQIFIPNRIQYLLTVQDFLHLERMEKLHTLLHEHLENAKTASLPESSTSTQNDPKQHAAQNNYADLLQKLHKALAPNLADYAGEDGQNEKQQALEMIDRLTADLEAAGVDKIPGFRARAFEQSRIVSTLMHVRSVTSHAFILVPLLLEIIFVKHHFLPHRCMLILSFLIFYAFLNALYCVFTGTAVYPPLDFCGNPLWATVYCAGLGVLMTLLYFGFYFLRIFPKKEGLDNADRVCKERLQKPWAEQEGGEEEREGGGA